jgi:hypothetical protein
MNSSSSWRVMVWNSPASQHRSHPTAHQGLAEVEFTELPRSDKNMMTGAW